MDKGIQFPKPRGVPDLGKLEKPYWSVVIAADEGLRFAVTQSDDEMGAAVNAVMKGPMTDLGQIGEIRVMKVKEMILVDHKEAQSKAVDEAKAELSGG